MSNQTVHFKNIREKIIETLETANSEVLIAVAWFTDDKIIKVLNELSYKSISISIIFYDDKINNKDLFKTLYYRKANINVSKKLMHNKFCIIDREIVINGSYNWTFNASTNDENIQITKYNDELVDSFVEQFYELKDKCKNLETYYKYSISNILEEIENFEYDFNKNIRGKTKTPYFYKIDNLNIHPIHKDVKLKNEIIIVKDLDEEYIVFFLLFFLQREFPLSELTKVTRVKYKIPETYSTLYDENFDSNKFIPLTKSRNILKSNFFKKELLEDKDIFDVLITNSTGEKINMFKECYELPDGFFCSNNTTQINTYFIFDKDFNQVLPDEKIVDYIVGFGCVIRKYVNNNKRYLLYNVKEKEFLKDHFLYYYEYNLRSYLFSETLDFAKKTISSGLVDFKLSGVFNTSHFIELVDALKFYNIISNERKILFKELYELQFRIKDLDDKIIFFELPCLEKKIDSVIKKPVIKRYYDTVFNFYRPYKKIFYDFKENKLIYEEKSKKFNDYYFYSDDDFEHSTLYKIIDKNDFILMEYDLNRIIKEQIEYKSYYKMSDKLDFQVKNSDWLYRLEVKRCNEKIKKEKNSCYIATMVYEDINHPKVELLRKFRDNVLNEYFLGRGFIKYYYQYSPRLVEKLKNYKKINFLIKIVLDLIIKIIK